MPVAIVCDFCNKPLEFDDGRYILYRTKKLNTRNIYPYLCKDCAKKIDNLFEVYEAGKVNSREVLAKFRKLNQERREKIGTKG